MIVDRRRPLSFPPVLFCRTFVPHAGSRLCIYDHLDPAEYDKHPDSQILTMGLKDKIPVVTLPIPTASPALLHATHFLFLLLTLLFLILPSFSGPATGYWWVLITLPIPGSTLGSVWDLGGFGGCKVGEMCEGKGGENVPIMAGQVMSTLMYHFAGTSSLPPQQSLSSFSFLGLWDTRGDLS